MNETWFKGQSVSDTDTETVTETVSAWDFESCNARV